MELVTSSRVVCRSRPQVDALPHVCHLIAACLTPPKSWTVETAIRHGCDRLTRHLLNELAENPALHYLTKRSRARWYLSVAASVGDLALMEHLVARFGCCVDDSAIKAAVRGGHLEALQWLYDQVMSGVTPGEGAEALKKRVLPDSNMGLASRIGNREMLQWMQNTVGSVAIDQILRGAARCGHMHIFKWALPMVELPLSDEDSFRLVDAAIGGGHFLMTEFVISKCRLQLASEAIASAICSSGQMDLVRLMHGNGGEGCTSRAIDYAARSGHLDAVQWLHSKGLGCSTYAMDGAAENGHLAVVKFLHENRSEGCTPAAFESAVDNNHLNVAQYLFEHRRGDCTDVWMDYAAGKGGLEMLKSLHANWIDVVECTSDAMDTAAANGHLDVVHFLHENRTEGCTTNAMDQAAQNGHLEVVTFLHENRIEGCTVNAMDQTAENGHLEVVKFLHDNRSEGCSTDAMDNAAVHGHLAVVEWLHFNRTEGVYDKCNGRSSDVRSLGHREISAYPSSRRLHDLGDGQRVRL